MYSGEVHRMSKQLRICNYWCITWPVVYFLSGSVEHPDWKERWRRPVTMFTRAHHSKMYFYLNYPAQYQTSLYIALRVNTHATKFWVTLRPANGWKVHIHYELVLLWPGFFRWVIRQKVLVALAPSYTKQIIVNKTHLHRLLAGCWSGSVEYIPEVLFVFDFCYPVL